MYLFKLQKNFDIKIEKNVNFEEMYNKMKKNYFIKILKSPALMIAINIATASPLHPILLLPLQLNIHHLPRIKSSVVPPAQLGTAKIGTVFVLLPLMRRLPGYLARIIGAVGVCKAS